jgi:hypothetical protein
LRPASAGETQSECSRRGILVQPSRWNSAVIAANSALRVLDMVRMTQYAEYAFTHTEDSATLRSDMSAV